MQAKTSDRSRNREGKNQTAMSQIEPIVSLILIAYLTPLTTIV